MVLVIYLKTKGIENRHINMMNKELGIKLNMYELTLRDLMKLDLHKGTKLEYIRQVVDQASKEYAIKLTYEAIKKEIEHTKMVVSEYKDTDTIIIRNIEGEIANFSEMELKTKTLL